MSFLLCSLIPPPPLSTPFPYTTLFRSHHAVTERAHAPARDDELAHLEELDLRHGLARRLLHDLRRVRALHLVAVHLAHDRAASRSEEHTSELQSRENLVCRLLLEKKKN